MFTLHLILRKTYFKVKTKLVLINMTENILGIIPARGGSKGIPRKNLVSIKGKPLIAYTIGESLKSKYLDKIVVSTEDDEITQVSQNYGAETIKRPTELSGDSVFTEDVLLDAANQLKIKENYFADIIVVLQPTSPLRTAYDIDQAITIYNKNNCDAVVSVSKTKHPPHWIYKLDNNNKMSKFISTREIRRRQDSPNLFQLNGAIFVTNISHLQNTRKIISDNTIAYIMPEERSIDIDSYFDLKITEFLLD